MAKQINFFDGANSGTVPTVGNIDTTSLIPYANDAAFEAANAGSPMEGNIYANTTTNSIRYYNGTAWISLPDATSTDTLENKTIDGTDATGNNTVLNDAVDVSFDNIASGLIATDMQAATDEIVDRLATAEGVGTTNSSDITSIETAISDLQSATGAGPGFTDMGTFTGSIISNNVSAKTALQELETALEAVGSPLDLQGNWDANTNSPTLTSGVGTQGHFYIVTVAGTTNLDGITDWQINDWAVYTGTAWIKVDNSEVVTSVNGQTGAVSLALDDLSDVNTSGVGARYEIRRDSGNTGYEVYDPNSTAANSQSGTAVELTTPSTAIVRATNAALVSIETIIAGFAGQRFTLVNKTATSLDILNETGAVASNRILTGTGATLSVPDNGSIDLFYDTTSSRWQVIGGVGSAGTTFPLLAPNGSAAAPSYSFSGATNAGMSISGSSLGFSHDGAFRLELNGDILRPTSGSAGIMVLGANNRRFNNIYTETLSMYNSSIVNFASVYQSTTSSGVTSVAQFRSESTIAVGLITANQSAASTHSKNIYIETGNAAGTTSNSGDINLTTGTATNLVGSINLVTGTSANAATGAIVLNTGAKTSTQLGASGNVLINSGDYSSNSNSKSGDVTIRTGDKSGTGTAATGDLMLRSGAHSGSGNAVTGNATLQSGDNTGSNTSKSGDVLVKSGDTSGAAKDSGAVNINSGASSLRNSGAIAIKSGTAGSGWSTGAVSMKSNNGSVTGAANLESGDASGGASGDVTIKTGTATTTRGKITLDANGVDASASIGAFRVPNLSADPGSPLNGDIWYNTTSNELKARVNGSTVVLA